MFRDLTDEAIQPESIDINVFPDVLISDELAKELKAMLIEEERGYAEVTSKTSVVQTDKNYVFFSNQWLYLAVLCKSYAEALFAYGDFFDKNIRRDANLLKAIEEKDYNTDKLMQLLPDSSDRKYLEKYIIADQDFRPGKQLINENKAPRSVKDIFGSCILKKLSVPDSSSNYLGNLVYYLSKRPDIFNKLEAELLKQKETAELQGLKKISPIVEFKKNLLPPLFHDVFSIRFITSLIAKPFVILTGNSGTGKTRIARNFSKYMEVTDENGEKNWLIVPVGADWTDNIKVLGFYNPLADNGKGKYEKTKILELIERANQNPGIPFFLVLDEMNLSHVERYFSDFLSHMERKDSIFELDGYESNLKYSDNQERQQQTVRNQKYENKLSYPDNLFVVGTVNIDETTYMFSPKVLDRANVIEFKPDKNDVMNLFDAEPEKAEIAPAGDGIAAAFLKLSKEIRNGKSDVMNDPSVAASDKVTEIFSKLYDITEKQGFEFAFRTVREIKQYITAAYELQEDKSMFDLDKTIDEQIVQKILPKIHGNKKEIGELLAELKALCPEDKMPLSYNKIDQMERKLSTVQYASFI